MARQVTISDEQILKAAREVFLAEGFTGRTSKIAERAGISEGSIFKRFPTKEALFFAALEIPHPPKWYSTIEGLAIADDARSNIISAMVVIIREMREMLPRMITVLGSRGPNNDPLKDLPEPLPVRDMKVIRRFLDSEVEIGRIRPCDTSVLVQVLFGPIHHYVFDALMRNIPRTPADDEAFAQAIVELLWNGIRPEGA